MLIECERHTKEDLDLWCELEEADLINYRISNMQFKEQKAINLIKEFSVKPFYVSVSWGKDSITVLHLAIRACVKLNVVTAVGNYKTVAFNDFYIKDVKNIFQSRYNFIYNEIIYPEYPPKSKQKVLYNYGRNNISRHILGIRSNESSIRKLSAKVHGNSTENVCRPILNWSTDDVFSYCAKHNLPLHPNYGFLGAGRYNRKFLRVGGSIGGEDGRNFGRAEWEKEYYLDVLNKIPHTCGDEPNII